MLIVLGNLNYNKQRLNEMNRSLIIIILFTVLVSGLKCVFPCILKMNANLTENAQFTKMLHD